MIMVKATLGVVGEVARLRAMSTTLLRARYTELFGTVPRTNNRSYLFKRLALRVQEPGQAALEKRGKTEATPPPPPSPLRDPRLPGIGAVLTKSYKGRDLKVVVNEGDFTFDGQTFRSLSAIARRVTGVAWNGFLFFNLMPTGKAV